MGTYGGDQYGTGTYGGAEVSTDVQLIHVREKPMLRQSYELETPSGRRYRWADDEIRPENVLTDGRYSSTMPGGFESLEGRLPRKPSLDYADLERLSTLRVFDASGGLEWEGRLERTPRTSDNEFSVSISAVGWQAHLEDDKSAKAIYRDIDLTRWGGSSVQRKLNVLAADYSPGDASVQPDATTGEPALVTQQEGPWLSTSVPAIEGWYDAQGISLGSVYYAWKRGSTVGTGGNWQWTVVLSDDDILTAEDSSGDLDAAGPGSGTLTAADTRAFARVLLTRAPPDTTGSVNVVYPIFWTTLAVYGDHGLTLRGTEPEAGFYASDVVPHALSFAPLLNYSTGVDGSISQSSFIIPQLTFLEPTTAAEIIKGADRFDLNDWAVWEDKTFYLHPRGARGRKWRARVGSAQLSETGPQVDRLWESIIVAYQDVDGTTRTVGPPGSGANTESADLKDSDPENPLNQLGITRRDLLTMGTGTAASATEVGRRFLEESKLLDTSGEAQFVGHIEDDRGVVHPASRVRAGDTVTFVDASDPSPRRIVRADHNRATRTTSVSLDSPPEGLAATLERLQVSLVSLGFN